ncbi:predicted protein [Streptomyces filamentosus NRRL 15998]|uniref:Predicted protein n=1 Tax=Streptomyces filamentosus NRRL 15998 TaxID=457431 RepID=D6AND4_STRFL|nr:predicted protein [Streptomyces filamentosus NRRL 15998]
MAALWPPQAINARCVPVVPVAYSGNAHPTKRPEADHRRCHHHGH